MAGSDQGHATCAVCGKVRGIVPQLQECVLDNIFRDCWIVKNSNGGGVRDEAVPLI